MRANDRLRECYAARGQAARAWKSGGGRIVGYFEDNVPEELIIAAGFLPYRLSGKPQVAPDTLKKYLFPMWKKHSLAERQVKLGFINSMIDLIFRGEFDFVDYLVIPYSRKSILAIWQQLHDAKRVYPELKLPPTWILDRAMTPSFDSSIFNQQRIFAFREQLEQWSGVAIKDEELARAIRLVNGQRTAVAALNGLRVEGKVSGAEALALTSAGKFMPVTDHTALLNEANAEIAGRAIRTGPRIFLAGSPQDNDQLYAVIEGAGGTVVAENHYWGAPAAYYPVATDMEPIIAIAHMYHAKPSSVVYPLQRAIDEIVERAVAARADAVIFSVYDNDNHEIWSVPLTIDALNAAGIPSLYLSQQPYLLGEARAQKTAITELFGRLGARA
jgi:benzoyl-CoA reductase/2-hydroxyglutaryl-CoA dehydratase subunit BcrC/BadD/HgdB